jgi:Calpain family cysteine protease
VVAILPRSAIQNLFITKEYNHEGIYRLRFYKGGEWVEVFIDDYIPCFPLGLPMFMHSTNYEIWLPLLEKAYAKLLGGYEQLIKGSVSEALGYLTGFPTQQLTLRDEAVFHLIETNKLWTVLRLFTS